MEAWYINRIASHGFLCRKNVEGKPSVSYHVPSRHSCTRAYKKEEDQLVDLYGDDTRGVPLQLNQGLMDAASSIEDDPVPRREFHENGGPLFSIDPAGPSNTDATFENGMGVGQPPAEGYTGSLGDGLKFITDAESEIDKERQMEGILEELERRKAEANDAPRSLAWGEAKKRDRLKALAEMEIIEDSPERVVHNRSLFAAAKKGRPDMAETIIEEMLTAGVIPGPKAHHAVIFAYVKAGDADGALTAIRRTHNSGVMPITESYLVLIHAFVKEDNLKTAEAILASMRRAGADGRQGWLVMIRSLLDIGDLTAAREHLKMGESHNWKPDSPLYEALMQEVCNTGKQRQGAQLLNEIREAGITLTTKHVNPYLDLISKNKKSSLKTIQKLSDLVAKPNVTTFNALLRGHLHQWSGTNNQEGLFMSVWMHLLETCAPNTTSMVLMVRAQMNMGNIQEAVRVFLDNKVGQAQGYAREELMGLVLPDLLRALSEEGKPIDMLRVLQSLVLDTCTVSNTIMQTSSAGNTFATIWLANRVTKLQKALESPDAETTPVVEMGSRLFRYGEFSVLLGFCNCAVEDDGTIRAISKLNVVQMVAELESRGINCEGLNRADLMNEVRISRSAWPAIADETKRRRRLKYKKGKMVKEGYDSSIIDALGPMGQYDTDIAGSVVQYGNGGEAIRSHLSEEDTLERLEEAIARVEALNSAQDKFRDMKEKEAAGKTANRAKSDDAEDAAAPSPSENGGTTAETTGENGENAGGKGETVGNTPATALERIDEVESMTRKQKDELVDVWQDSMELDSTFGSTRFGNSSAGVMVAVKIVEVLQTLGQTLTLEDFQTLASGVITEKNPASGMVVGKMVAKLSATTTLPSLIWKLSISQQEKEILYKEQLSDSLTACARTCLEEGYPDSALQIVNAMIDSEITPPPSLVSKIKRQKADPSKKPVLDGLPGLGKSTPVIDQQPGSLLLEGENSTG